MLNMQYIYPTSADNGRIRQTIDGISGETVTYTYDQLNRLASATSSTGSWVQNYKYDGFGNLLGTNGTAVWPVDPATNRLGTTDANGNSLANNNSWDVENHLVSAPNPNGYQYNSYGYDPWGKRFSQTISGQTDTTVYFYGLNGRMLQSFDCTPSNSNGDPQCGSLKVNQYFGGKLISNGAGNNQQPTATDRLGSVRTVNGSRVSYYPYGQERAQSNGQTTPDGTDKFATYFRDWIGQDYADQRYYNQAGRFFSPDPGGIKTADPSNPGSWNRYAYANGDPMNLKDPTGMIACDPEDEDDCYVDPEQAQDLCDMGYETYCSDEGGGGGGDPTDPPVLVSTTVYAVADPTAVPTFSVTTWSTSLPSNDPGPWSIGAVFYPGQNPAYNAAKAATRGVKPSPPPTLTPQPVQPPVIETTPPDKITQLMKWILENPTGLNILGDLLIVVNPCTTGANLQARQQLGCSSTGPKM